MTVEEMIKDLGVEELLMEDGDQDSFVRVSKGFVLNNLCNVLSRGGKFGDDGRILYDLCGWGKTSYFWFDTDLTAYPKYEHEDKH